MYRFQLFRLCALFIDLFQEGRELDKAEVFPVALFPAKQAENFGVLHEKHRILISGRCAKKNISEPLHRAETLAAFEAQFLFAMNNQQRIARDGIERLHASTDQNWNFTEPREIDIVLGDLVRPPVRGDPTRSKKPNERGQETFHASAVLRFRENPTR